MGTVGIKMTRLDRLEKDIEEIKMEIYEEVSVLEKRAEVLTQRIEVLALTQRQILTAVSELENER